MRFLLTLAMCGWPIGGVREANAGAPPPTVTELVRYPHGIDWSDISGLYVAPDGRAYVTYYDARHKRAPFRLLGTEKPKKSIPIGKTDLALYPGINGDWAVFLPNEDRRTLEQVNLRTGARRVVEMPGKIYEINSVRPDGAVLMEHDSERGQVVSVWPPDAPVHTYDRTPRGDLAFTADTGAVYADLYADPFASPPTPRTGGLFSLDTMTLTEPRTAPPPLVRPIQAHNARDKLDVDPDAQGPDDGWRVDISYFLGFSCPRGTLMDSIELWRDREHTFLFGVLTASGAVVHATTEGVVRVAFPGGLHAWASQGCLDERNQRVAAATAERERRESEEAASEARRRDEERDRAEQAAAKERERDAQAEADRAREARRQADAVRISGDYVAKFQRDAREALVEIARRKGFTYAYFETYIRGAPGSNALGYAYPPSGAREVLLAVAADPSAVNRIGPDSGRPGSSPLFTVQVPAAELYQLLFAHVDEKSGVHEVPLYVMVFSR